MSPTHQDPQLFPRKGLRYNVNIPLPLGTGDSLYLKAMREIVAPIKGIRAPIRVCVSGFRRSLCDPAGNLSLSTRCYKKIYEAIVNWHQKFAGKTCISFGRRLQS
ncbi:MAG: hypothetical protein ACUVQL_02065 [Candidatus Bathycorpusculaceae bacterium]